MSAAPCPHGCGAVRPAAHHYRDAGDVTPERAAELGYCPVLTARRNGTPITTEEQPPMPTMTPPRDRLDLLEAEFAGLRMSKRELRRKLARAEWLLEVRNAGMDRVVDHNGVLEARLRSLEYADLATLHLEDIDVHLVEQLRQLGDKFGPRGVVLAALAILGGRQ